MCDVLKEIYRKVYDEQFVYDNLEHRIKLQKAVYILENMGVYVGDYSFSWNEYGPYSLGLDCDAKNLKNSKEKKVVFSQTAEKAIEIIKGYLDKNVGYSQANWMECIASLHYLMHVLMIQNKELLKKLGEGKSYLSNPVANKKALSIAESIKMVY